MRGHEFARVFRLMAPELITLQQILFPAITSVG
ncbi:hypothetical protein DSM3645_03993 [Blastopirellula marina DSM 3645]|uniref:Uncharacterized protein n=1 Tax=Blastopirellula marina DSM 3645 TaxID=314230 RepID=A3ZV40_9BACT|nr:hypothetical protein DSM3645_03993 [Blastopirellula marina DSM 3645]